MNIYNISGSPLSNAYNIDGLSLSRAYDINQNIWNKESATDILTWLQIGVDDTSDGKRIKERYRMDTSEWVTVYRPDCNLESALAFLKAYQNYGEQSYLTLARNIIQSILLLQNQNGSFPFSHIRTTVYTNDNSEVIMSLVRASDIDIENASSYISVALDVADFLVSIQNSDGSWRVSDANSVKTALFTGHAVSALSFIYTYGSSTQKANYQTAIEKGLTFITSQILTGGRIKCCSEVNLNTEYWRAPTSDQSVCIRAFALAEYYLPNNANVSSWETARQSLTDYLDGLITENGAVRNGSGTGVNGADIYYYTDHIYTTAFAIEAYYWSWKATNNSSYLTTANKIISFCKSNIYYSNNQNANGVIRGAYNLRDHNWDTSELTIDPNVQVGSDQLYTGWSNAPIAYWFLANLSSYSGKTLSILGDSISTYAGYIPTGQNYAYDGTTLGVSSVNDTWWMKLINAFGMTLNINNSWSGTCVSNIRDSAKGSNSNAMVRSELLGTSPDVIIFYMGINDFLFEAPLGEYEGGLPIPSDPSTFSSAFAISLNKMLSKYPNAEIWCATMLPCKPNINEDNIPLSDFNERLKEIVLAFGMKFIDFTNCGITYENMNIYMGDWDSSTSTGEHPNADGMSLMANQVIRRLDPSIRTRY